MKNTSLKIAVSGAAFAFGSLAAAAWAQTPPPASGDQIVTPAAFARINGQIITKDEYIKALERQSVTVPGGAQPINAGRLVIDQMIGNKITLTEAAKAKVLPTDAEVNRYYELQKKLYENQVLNKNYEDTLKEQGTTPDEVKTNFRAELAESNLYAKQLKLDESEVRLAYDKAQGQIGLPARVQLRLILTTADSPEFAKVQQMLQAKTPFEQVAREINAAPQLKTTGGLVSQTTPINQIAPAFQDRVKQSEEGSIIGPVDFALAEGQPPAKAWVKVEKKLPAFTIPFEDAAVLVRKQLVQQKLLQPQNASVRNAIMNQKLEAKFEPTDTRYADVWESIRKSAIDAGVGKAQTINPPVPVMPIAQNPVRNQNPLTPTPAAQVVSPPNFAALRGTLKADKKAVRDSEIITFTYSVTNTSKNAQTLDFSSGQRFDMTVSAKGSATPLWQMSAAMSYTMMLGRLPLAPGETKTFTATWTSPIGTAKPGSVFVATAYLTPRNTTGTGTSPQPARASLILLAAHK